ncbi:peptidoglycan-binding protein [Streptomyces sp. NEAU-H3]|uniref:peptidoglycan-binding protein n=1 Tax=Streptomyces sp. NEAU-H3 TaxID=2720636 RepID=UPI00143AC150|nr:peptidoglycan-binding protein [Streptomyces sp. NEAU-H3]NJA56747.1 hypothetical protein [Streptomyces sp. NEAU-H3]
MTRAKDEDTPPTTPPAEQTPATSAPTPATENSDSYEPYPGPEFFHAGRTSPIIRAMSRRLIAGGFGSPGTLGDSWTRAHRRSVTAFQESLRPKGGGDVSGIPDQVAWDKLHVPPVSASPRVREA